MVKVGLRSLVITVFGVSFVSSQIIIPVFHPLSEGRTTQCNLSEKAVNDYYNGRDLIFTFLESAETNFRYMDVDEKRMACQRTKRNLADLIERGKVDWAPCLNDGYEYIGDFINDTFQNFLDFFCEDSNDHIEGYFTEEAKQCRADIKKPLFDNCLITLLAKQHAQIEYDLSFNTFSMPQKRDNLCRKVLDIGPCATDILALHCPHLDYYQQLSAKLFAQTVKTCDGYVEYLSVAKVVGWTLTVISICICVVVRFCPVRRWFGDFRQRMTSKTLTNSVTALT